MIEELEISLVKPEHAEAVALIYNHYVAHSTATFEEQPLTAGQMLSRVEECNANRLPWLVAEYAGKVIGYAYASRWNGRCAYRFTVEVTVYLEPNITNSGVGTALYRELLSRLRELSLKSVIAGISLPNEASVALHEKFGMRKVAHFNDVGYKFETWIDVGYWQVTLDSPVLDDLLCESLA